MKKQFLKICILAFALTALICVSALAFDVQGGTISATSPKIVRSAPNTSSDVLMRIADEERIAVLDLEGDFYKAAYKGVNGYIHKDYVELQDIMNVTPGNAKITASALNVRSAPGTGNSVITKLYEGSVVKVIGINNGWFKISFNGTSGYVHPDYVQIVASASSSVTATSKTVSSTSLSLRQQILAYAESFIGVPYVYGGETPSGFDCSGLVKYVYNHFGISIARCSADQYGKSVTKISRSNLNIGDLVFFSGNTAGVVGHVGIYAGNGMFLHAPSPGKSVQYDSLDSTYYTAHYIGCGTMLY